MVSSHVAKTAFVLLALVACAQAACHCYITCNANGLSYYASYDVDCDNCSSYCQGEYPYIAGENCPPGGYTDSYSICVSGLAVGVIAAIVVGVALLVICAPVIICFCLGAACFSYRKRDAGYTVVHHSNTYGTA